MRSPVEERGSSCKNTSRSWKLGTTFSIPTTEIRVLGRVRHIRPLPSDSTTTMVPVSATAKFAPETATASDMSRNFSRRKRRAASASSEGSSERLVQVRHRPQEDLADLGAVAVDRGHQDVAGGVPGQLDDQLGQVGLDGLDAGMGQGLVQPDLLGRHRLDLEDLAGLALER